MMTIKLPAIAVLIILTAAMHPAAAKGKARGLPYAYPDCKESWEWTNNPRRDEDVRLYHGCVMESKELEDAKDASSRAANLAACGHYDEAEEQITKALAVNSTKERLLTRAKLRTRLGKYDAAATDLRSILATRNVFWSDFYKVGLAAMEIGQYDLAEQAFKCAVDTNPGLPPEYYLEGLAHAQEKLGKKELAIESYRAATIAFLADSTDEGAKKCIARINNLTSSTKRKPVTAKDFAVPDANLARVKALVNRLAAEQNPFDANFLRECTDGDMRVAGRSKDIYEIGKNHFEGLQLVTVQENAHQSGVSQRRLMIHMNRHFCCVTEADLRETTKKLILGKPRGMWRREIAYTRCYEVPAGTLVLSFGNGGFGGLFSIDLFAPSSVPTSVPVDEVKQLATENGRYMHMNHLLSVKKFHQALGFNDTWLSHAPSSPLAYRKRAEALFCLKRYREAVKATDKAISLANGAAEYKLDKQQTVIFNDPRYGGNLLLIDRGKYLQASGRNEDALQSYKNAFPSPMKSDHYLLRARAYIGLNRLDKARADLRTAVAMFFDEGRIVRRDEAATVLASIGNVYTATNDSDDTQAVPEKETSTMQPADSSTEPADRSGWMQVIHNGVIFFPEYFLLTTQSGEKRLVSYLKTGSAAHALAADKHDLFDWYRRFAETLSRSYVPKAPGGIIALTELKKGHTNSISFFGMQPIPDSQPKPSERQRADEAAIKQSVVSALQKAVADPSLSLPEGVESIEMRLGFAGNPSGGSYQLTVSSEELSQVLAGQLAPDFLYRYTAGKGDDGPTINVSTKMMGSIGIPIDASARDGKKK